MGITFDVAFWISSFVISTTLIFFMTYSLILVSDTLIDHINPKELYAKLNTLLVPEYVIHSGLVCLYIVKSYVMMAIFHMPLLSYHVYIYYTFYYHRAIGAASASGSKRNAAKSRMDNLSLSSSSYMSPIMDAMVDDYHRQDQMYNSTHDENSVSKLKTRLKIKLTVYFAGLLQLGYYFIRAIMKK